MCRQWQSCDHFSYGEINQSQFRDHGIPNLGSPQLTDFLVESILHQGAHPVVFILSLKDEIIGDGFVDDTVVITPIRIAQNHQVYPRADGSPEMPMAGCFPSSNGSAGSINHHAASTNIC